MLHNHIMSYHIVSCYITSRVVLPRLASSHHIALLWRQHRRMPSSRGVDGGKLDELADPEPGGVRLRRVSFARATPFADDGKRERASRVCSPADIKVPTRVVTPCGHWRGLAAEELEEAAGDPGQLARPAHLAGGGGAMWQC